ncbi:MAG: D-2-hydroxyacid dehydrogenase [Bryobacteraceae bacterium]
MHNSSVVVAILSFATLVAGAERKIVITGADRQAWAFNDRAMREYRAAAKDVNFVMATSPADLAREITDADAVIGGIARDLFPKARKLKWVQSYSAGVEDYNWKEFVESDVVLTNCKIVQGPNIADHAMAMLLALTRGLNRYIPGKVKEEWDRGGEGLQELQDMTAVIIGVGGIGSQIAQRAHGFGMKVIGVDPKDMPPSLNVSRMVYPYQLDTVLPLADVVFVAAPLTSESRRMVGQRQFDLMKRNSYFIAVSRGGLYDTNALMKALDGKRLAGAGLDVTDPEPLPKGHALWKFPNVVITPHVAGTSPGSHNRRVGVIRENILRFARGEPLINVVDKRKGY